MNQFLQPLVLCDLSLQETLSLPELAAQSLGRLQAGQRLVTWYGRAALDSEPEGTFVTAVFAAPGQPLTVLRGQALKGENYPSLTASFPAAQIFERELWEQTGLVPDAHPWLKPVRFEGERQGRMAEYPFFQVRGDAVHEVGVGPIHASVIEPGHFRFMCHGEKVYHLEIQLGYQHRGVEALLLRRPAGSLTPLVESICGDSVVAYAWAHCAAVESLSGLTTDRAVQASRAIGLELERIAIHLATLNGLATDIAFLQGGATYGRLRTAIINASQRICGNRFGRGWMRPGQARPLNDAQRHDLSSILVDFSRDAAEVNQLMLGARSVKARFVGTGVLTSQAAQDLGLTGVVARASGVMTDVRSERPGTVYQEWPMPLLTESAGDCWARMALRMREVDASVHWLLQVLDDPTLDLEKPPATAGPATLNLRPQSLCVSLVEGTRGPVVQALETDRTGELLHYKVQDPSLVNWFGLALAVRDIGISDFPVCNKSFDLSYCGNDL